MNKSYYIETYGCQMNVADSELIAGLLMQNGYESTTDIHRASAIFVNTCAIREHAEEKVHSRLGEFNQIKKQNPGVIIGVLGCMVQHLKDDILEHKPYVDIVLGPDSYRNLPDILNRKNKDASQIVDTTLSRFEVYDDLFPSRKEGINAWISIMRGCDKFCSFCIVPFTRGRERSRSVASIVREAEQAVAQGFAEITLLGQNVNSYHYQEDRFPELLDRVAQVPGIKRIRFTSPHPSDVTEKMLDVMAAHRNLCNYIHFPLQAGSDAVLKRMNRTYTRDHFVRMVGLIRDKLPGVGISTDIIVGFPGETDEDFRQTLEVMEAVKFDSAFTFKYSPRPWTKAAQYSHQVPEYVKQACLEELIQLQKKHTLLRNQELVGTDQEVLVEKESKRSDRQWAGRTDANKWVIFDKGEARIKDIVTVRIEEARGVSLHGTIIEKEVALCD